MTTLGLASCMLWVSLTIRLGVVRGLLLDLLVIIPRWLAFFWLFFCLMVFTEAVPHYSDEPVKWRVLSSLRIGIWATLFALVAIMWGFIFIRQRRERGLKLWLPGFSIGWLGFAIQLYLVDGYGWEELQYTLRLPWDIVLNAIVMVKKTPEVIWLIKMKMKHSDYTADEDS